MRRKAKMKMVKLLPLKVYPFTLRYADSNCINLVIACSVGLGQKIFQSVVTHILADVGLH